MSTQGLLTAFSPFIPLPDGRMRPNTSEAVLEYIKGDESLSRRLQEAMGVEELHFAVIDAMRMGIKESVNDVLEGSGLNDYVAVVSLGEGGPTLEDVNVKAPFGSAVANYDRVCIEFQAGNKILGGRFGNPGPHRVDHAVDIDDKMRHRDAGVLMSLFVDAEGIRVNDSDYGAGTDLCNALNRLLFQWMRESEDRRGFFAHVPAVIEGDEDSLTTILSIPAYANLFRGWASMELKNDNPPLDNKEISTIGPRVIRHSVAWIAENVVRAAERTLLTKPSKSVR